MIVLYQNGERINPSNGYPMRLLVPGYEGNMSNRGKSRGGQGGWVLARIRLASGGTAAPGRLSRAPR
jgi:hypothetical protein